MFLKFANLSLLFIRRFANLLIKKDISNSETKKELLKKVKSAISATAERFSGYVQNVSVN